VKNSLAVIVPIYDPAFEQKPRILRMIASITNQTVAPEELVVTCSHEIPYLQEIEKALLGKTLLKFFRNGSKSAPENLNLAVEASKSSLVKILFQDDFLVGANHLEILTSKLENSPSQWAVSSSTDFYEELRLFRKPRTPKFAESLSKGVNKIGAPSVAIFRRESFVSFDERLKYVFDCEWYLSMKHKHGEPTIIAEAKVGIGIHPDQATHWAKSLLKTEVAVVEDKHRRQFRGMFKHKICSCE
jgi:hypothetical protein